MASSAFVLLAAICWGLSGGIGGLLIDNGWSPAFVSLVRGVIGLLMMMLWFILRPTGNGLKSPRLWVWAVIAGLGVAGNFAFYFLSVAQGSVAVAATLMYCAPVFVFLISFALNLERPSRLKWVAILLVMTGIVLLTGIYDSSGEKISLIGIIAGLLAGLSYSLFIFGFKLAAPHGSPQTILVIAFATLVLALSWSGTGGRFPDAVSSTDWPLFLTLGLLGGGLSFILYLLGLSRSTPALASVIAMIEPVTASLFGMLVLDESLAGIQLLGMALILFTVTLLSVHSSDPPAPTRPPAG
ncbi:DMT family transporter [Bowmanella dokdonensis]|uniref:EamA family transporter n=1 Tax=Bowmanella dokdonensis TaxID=751969 RepID=A0A939DMV1_9ALTE|nr:DMT family transporter [Bowmanella dokdonensis]MBN7825147.1 EamA family transporter [Bowmanella dokdonensis]